ncbi:MAG TPA: SDR family oxidoreductase [Acidimicrobiales bacterium]|jgi:NAD(P)-dependent dehydrogenase (short-subunit alcohol dehydrogenase family)|nr:SDR family oxidoreductase [Acidimicrobiales bacterium]
MSRKVAFVTGASRGIGKACARYLAEAGFDIALTARTVHEGESREHSSTVKSSNTKPLPGSLDATAALVAETGREVMIVPADILDYATIGAAVTQVLERWGRIDVVVNNARYIGPGHMDRLLDTPLELLDKHLQGNVLTPILIAKMVIPKMIEHGGGHIINITSASGYADPTKPAGEGGWGMGYGISKGAMHRVAGFLHIEHSPQGVYSYNVQPGYISTERIKADMAGFGFADNGQPPDVVGAVCAWLATSPEAKDYSGKNIEAQFFCHERKLLPWWAGPQPNEAAITYDTSGADLMRLEAELLAQSLGTS